MRTFEYKELDQEGLETLETIAAAENFNRWMYETVSNCLKPGSILEVGSGIGNISRFFLDAGKPITLSDIRENYCGYLQQEFKGQDSLQDIVKLDLVHPTFEEEYSEYLGTFDNLYALNVIEHIEDDVLALANCKKLLKPDGRIVILVPAYQWLYNKFDENLYHYRRYTRKTMSEVFRKNNYKILKSFHFNLIGMAGWFVSGNLLKNRDHPIRPDELIQQTCPHFSLD